MEVGRCRVFPCVECTGVGGRLLVLWQRINSSMCSGWTEATDARRKSRVLGFPYVHVQARQPARASEHGFM